jgi:hypothetical protein
MARLSGVAKTSRRYRDDQLSEMTPTAVSKMTEIRTDSAAYTICGSESYIPWSSA